MRHRIFLPLCALLAALFLLPLWPASIQAGETGAEKKLQDWELGYRFFVGGFRALEAELDLSLSETAYSIDTRAETIGLIGSLASWTTETKSRGLVEESRLTAQFHETSNIWRGKERRRTITFDPVKGAVVQRFIDDDLRKEREAALEPEDIVGSTDMLTAVLQIIHQAKNGISAAEICSGRLPVYDGSHRFDYVLSHKGSNRLSRNRTALYDGSAELCELRFEMIGGFDARDQGRYFYKHFGAGGASFAEQPDRPAVRFWLARPQDAAPLLPVRIELETPFGRSIAHLRTLRPATQAAELR